MARAALALLCAALAATHAQTTPWEIAAAENNPKLIYASGSLPDGKAATDSVGATLGAADLVSVWHDTVTSPLVLQLVVAIPSTITLATPSSSWIAVSSLNSPSTLSSAVTVSAPIITSTALTYNITLRNAYGAYTFTFNPAALVSTSNVAATYTNGVFTSVVPSATVRAGFSPALSITNNGAVVTNSWLDPSSTGNVLSIASGSTTTGLATASGASAPASPCLDYVAGSNSTCPSDAMAFTSLSYSAAGAAYSFTLGTVTDPATWLAGTYLLPIAQGKFVRSDSVANYKVTLPVRVGWRPQLSFIDSANYRGVDTSASVSLSSSSGFVPADYWFNAGLSALSLAVASSVSVNGVESVDYTNSVPPATLDALLGVTAATRPGALARNGGIQSFGVATSDGTGATLKTYFNLSISGLPPGNYSFTIPAGTLRSASNGATPILNCAVKAVLKIGFVPRVSTFSVSTGSDVTGTWLDPSGAFDLYQVALLPSVGFALSVPTVGPAGAAVFNVMPASGDSPPGTTGQRIVADADAGVFTTSSARYSLVGLAPNVAQTVNVTAGALTRSDGVVSTFTYATLKVGFAPDVSFNDAFGHRSFFQPYNGSSLFTKYALTAGATVDPNAYFYSPRNSAVSLVLAHPSLTAIAYAAPATTSTGGLFQGATLAGFPSPAQVFGASNISTGNATYTLSIASTAPGTYALPISAGAVCTAGGICNAPTIAQLFVGYDIQPRLSAKFLTGGAVGSADYAEYLPDGTPVEPGQWFVDIAPGPGFYFASAADANRAAPTYIDTVGPADNLGSAFTLFPTGCTFDASKSAFFNPYQYTYANSYGGIDYVTLSAPEACTAAAAVGGVIVGPYGTYLLRIASGKLQRDDGVYNAPLEYPVTLGFPVSVEVGTNTATSITTSEKVNLRPDGAYVLSVKPGVTAYVAPSATAAYTGTLGVSTTVAVPTTSPSQPLTFSSSTATAFSMPPFSTQRGGLFAGQAATPAQGFLIGVHSATTTSDSLNYDLTFSANVSYGAYPIRISPGALNATLTTPPSGFSPIYYSATSFSVIRVGFVPELAVVNAAGQDVTGTFLRASAAASIAQQEDLFLRIRVADTVLAQQLALANFNLPFAASTGASAVTVYAASATSALASSAVANAAYTAHPYSGPTVRPFPGGLDLTYQIAGTLSTAGGFGTAFALTTATTWDIVRDQGGLHKLAIAAGTLCTAAGEFCNADVDTGSRITQNAFAVVDAGVSTATSPTATSLTTQDSTFLGGWLKGSATVPSSFPTGTWASKVTAVFSFEGASAIASGSIIATSSSNEISFSTPTCSAGTAVNLVIPTLCYITITLSNAPQGAYDMTIAPASTTETFSPATVRIIKGFQARAFSVNSPFTAMPRRGEALVVAASEINLAFLGLTFKSSTLPFGAVLTSAVDARGNDVRGIITCSDVGTNATKDCSEATPSGLSISFPLGVAARAAGIFFSSYNISVGGLSDGTYTLGLTADPTLVTDTIGTTPAANSTATLIIDRTPPVATPTVATFTITAGAFNQSLRIPEGMFRDAISPASALNITLLNPVAGWGLARGPGSSVVLTTSAFSPAPSDTPIVFLLQAADEAGNVAQAPLSLTIAAPVAASLTVADARGSTGTPTAQLVTAPAADGSVTLTVTAVFGSAVGPLTRASLTCRAGTQGFGNTLQLSGAPCNAAVTVSPGDGVTLSRRFVYTVVIPAGVVRSVANAGASAGFQFGLLHAGAATAAGVRAAPALPVFAAIDSRAPVKGQGASTSWCYGATVGVAYSQPLPYSLFADAYTNSSRLTVTAASPASQFGLTFTPGLLGTGARITGKVTALPAGGVLTFALTVADAAGNAATFPAAISIPVIAALSPANPTFTMRTTPLAFTKPLAQTATSVALLVDSTAAVGGLPSSGLSTGQVFVQLQTPDLPASGCGLVAVSDPVSTTISTGECTEYVYSTSSSFPLVTANTPQGLPVQSTPVQSSYYDVNSGFVETILSPTSPNTNDYLTQATINTFLSTLTYVNKGANVTAGPRVVYVYVLASNNGPIVAYASRTINVVTANSLPVLTAGAAATTLATYGAAVVAGTPPTIDEASATDKLLFGATSLSNFLPPAIADADDATLTSASVVITACDSARDVLYVGDAAGAFTDRQISSATHTWALRRAVYGTWVPSTCTLTIKPAPGSSAAPVSAFTAALAAVNFTSKDPKNPTGWATPASATATELTATRAFTVTVTDASASGRASSPATSAALSGTFTISAANRDAVINRRLAYSTFLSSTNVSANSYRSYVDAAGIIPYKKMFVDNSRSTATLTINLGVSAVKGVFAGGAITDADTALIGTYATVPSVSDFITWLAPSITTPPPTLLISSSFTASSGVLTVTITGITPSASGEAVLNFNWPSTLTGTTATPSSIGTITLPFVIDFRAPGCTLSGALNVASNLAVTLPDNSQCTFAPTTIAATSTAGTLTTVAVGSFVAANASLAAAVAQLAALNVPLAQQVAALSAQRNAARGASAVAIDPSSIIGAGSVAITTALASPATQALIQALPGAPADQSLTLVLGPSGQRFSKPVQVCIFVGDTPADAYRVLYVTSQVDDANAAKGFGPLSALSNQLFNPATGQLCGDTLHFSAFVPVSLPLPAVPMVPKASGVGGACPNQCSGQGFCRKEGKCACFAGFLGYDCSSRACPSGASWGQGSGGGSGLTAVAIGGDATLVEASVHEDAECSGRGVCDRAKAACKCFTGYEGPACQRIACPNACSGNGKCRFLGELPAASAAEVSSWEAARVQKCVCDGGWMGADCSQRTCPYGDDPETICADTARQVQRVALYYGAGPGAASSFPTGATVSGADFAASALALRFRAADGSVFTTPAIANAWASDAVTAAAASARLAAGLTSLPSGAVSGVSVSADFASAAASRTFDVTFTGPTNTGNEALLSCATNSDGVTLGCTVAGCRPLFAQPRLLNVASSVSLSGAVGVNAAAILMQPAGVPGGGSAASAAASGAWGVQTTLTLTPTTYQWSATQVYGTATGAPEPVTPLPPAALRAGVQGPYGLLVDIGDAASLSALLPNPSSSVAVTFQWSLPTCAVTQVAAAAADYEKAECSNRGVCDRTAGKCTCFTGYSGSACNAQVMYV